MKLPTYEKDHYELDNGEELNKAYPESFWIPEKGLRENLNVGDLVKLIFRMEETKGSDDISVERMWVEITGKQSHFYTGKLVNEPSGSDCIICRQNIIFQSCHVIDVYEENT